MELHLYPDMVILPDFCFFVYSFAKKMTNKIPRKICKKVRQYTIYNNFLQFIKKYLHYLNISYIISFGLRMDSRVAKGGSNFERTHCIANSHVMKEVIEARVISTSSPIEGAIIVEPTLEDLYLKLFSDELQEG